MNWRVVRMGWSPLPLPPCDGRIILLIRFGADSFGADSLFDEGLFELLPSSTPSSQPELSLPASNRVLAKPADIVTESQRFDDGTTRVSDSPSARA